MNLSGSSSSLTSDASTKAVSLRSYGIGGALLHKRIELMTRQHSRERSRERESQKEEKRNEVEKETEKMQEETEAFQRGLFPSEQSRGRSRLEDNQRAQADSQLMLKSVRAGRTSMHMAHPMTHAGSPLNLQELRPLPPSPLTQPQLMRPKPTESPIRARLMSPIRILRERSQSRERPRVNSGEGTQGVVSSSPQDERQEQAEQRARRSVSPNPFVWLCRDRRSRRKTVWQRELSHLLTLREWKLAVWILFKRLMVDYISVSDDRLLNILFWRHKSKC